MRRTRAEILLRQAGWGVLCLSLTVCCLFTVPVSHSAGQSADALDTQQHRQQERERSLRQRNDPDSNVRLKRADADLRDFPANESPCVPIHSLRLEGDSAARFQWALEAAKDAKGRCLGEKGLLLAINKVQNAILAKGYVTTRVMAQEQDLTQGVLTLQLQPGRIANIAFDESVTWRGRLWNAMPASPEDILNLRDIEQGLDNFQRLPSARADIRILPGEEDGTSDLKISWKEGRPARLTLGLDDSGSNKTGRYLGSTTLAIDAPFAHNDLFYANISKALFHRAPQSSRSHSINYFFPLGYWALSAHYNDHNYMQAIAQANDTFRYTGRSDNAQMTLSRLLFRNQSHKTTLNMRLYRRHSTNATDGIQHENQHRRTAGWELGLNQRSYLGVSTLDASLNWRRGTGAFGAKRATEEETHQGSARNGFILGDLSFNQPLAWGEKPWRYYTSLRGQWSANALTPQERMAIAGRYTVRGFDGEEVLSGEKGLLWRNELAWSALQKGHELYWAADYGGVYGQSTRKLAGRGLAGTAVGARGALFGHLSYDLFAGVPIYKPKAFHTSGATAGFSLYLDI